MSFAPVGSPVTGIGEVAPPALTLALTPTTLGNIEVVAVGNQYGLFSSSVSLSGGGVTSWQQLEFYGDATASGNSVLFWGVITATGSQTLTITSSGGYVSAIAQEFSVTKPVSNDTTNGATSTGTSGNYPPVTPSGAGELYLGTLFGDQTLGGASAGFTYIAGATDPFAGSIQQLVYAIGPTGSTSPAWTSGTTVYVPGRFLAAGFLKETTTPVNQVVMLIGD